MQQQEHLKNWSAVLAYVQDAGRKLGQTKFFEDVKRGRLKKQADGSFRRRDVDRYMASLPLRETPDGVVERAAERQRKKEEAEPFGTFTVKEAGTYEVAAYNVCGAESVKTQVSVPDYLFGQRICGRVTCQGKGIAGVVVTDGFDCVITDGQGRYELKRNRGARFVYISSPAGYLVPVSEQTIPQFYLPLDSLKEKDYDFELLK